LGHSSPKGRSRKIRRHLVPLTPLTMELAAAARAIGGDSEFLFPTTSKNGALTTSGVEVAWNRSRPKLGLSESISTISASLPRSAYEGWGIDMLLTWCSVTRHEALLTHTTIQSDEPDKRTALEAWSDYVRKTATIDDTQLSLDLLRSAA
jgi:integrase